AREKVRRCGQGATRSTTTTLRPFGPMYAAADRTADKGHRSRNGGVAMLTAAEPGQRALAANLALLRAGKTAIAGTSPATTPLRGSNAMRKSAAGCWLLAASCHLGRRSAPLS